MKDPRKNQPWRLYLIPERNASGIRKAERTSPAKSITTTLKEV